MTAAPLIIMGAYLWGAIPTAYLVGRYFKGIDIRQYGSGNVGASNVSKLLGSRAGLLLGTFDSVGKGALVVVVAKALDQSLAVQASVGIAVIVGHCWSPYIGLTGGRGVATAIGVLLGMLMWKELLIEAVALGIIGRAILRETAMWTLVAMFLLPVLTVLFRQPIELHFMAIAIGIVLMLKRLTANWERPVEGHAKARVLLYRLVWDRDVAHDEDWTARRPETS